MVNTLKKNIVVAVGFNIIFLVMYLVLSTCCFGSLDDFFMSAVLTGAYGSEYDVHLYFINAIYGYFLKPLYLLFPKVGWYYIFEVLEIFTSFTVFSYLLIDRLGKKYGLILSFLLLTCVAPDFYYQVGFTQCAEVLTAAGMLLIFCGNWKNKKKRLIFGGFLFVFGFVMRSHAFYMGLPYIFVFLGGRIIIEKKLPWSSIVTLVFSVLMIVCLFNFDKSLYSEGEYKYYADYQKPRAVLGDGGYYQREGVFTELNEREFRGDLFRAAGSWVFYDTEALNIDSLASIMAAVDNNMYSINVPRTIVRIFAEISSALFNTNAWCWVILCVVVIVCGIRYGSWYPWISLGIIICCYIYLLSVNRVLYHVQVGVWVYAVVGSIPFFKKELLEKVRLSRFVYVIFTFMCFAGYCYSYYSQPERLRRISSSSLANKDWMLFSDYAALHDKDVFMLSFNQYKKYAENIQGKSFYAITPGSFNNIFPFGYWNINLPEMKRELEARNVTNPVKDLVHENVFTLEQPFEFTFKPSTFFEWHYKKRLHSDTVASFGNLKLIRYKEIECIR